MLLRQVTIFLVLGVLIDGALAGPGDKKSTDEDEPPTNKWLAKVRSGGEGEMHRVAIKYGFDPPTLVSWMQLANFNIRLVLSCRLMMTPAFLRMTVCMNLRCQGGAHHQ